MKDITMWKFQLHLASKYLLGRKLRSVLTTLAIVIGTLLIFGTNIMLPTMVKSFQANIQSISGQVDVTITQKAGESFSRNVVNKVNTIPGIREISGSLSRAVNIPTGYYPNSTITVLSLTGIIPQSAEKMRRYPVTEGRFLSGGDTQSTVITQSLADELGLKLGDKLSLPTTEGAVNLKIVGLLPARAIPGNEEVLVTLAEAQNLLNLPAMVNTIELNLDTTDQAQRDLITNNIQSMLGDYFTLGALSAGTEMLASLKVGQIAINLFGFLALFMGAFIIFNTFRTIVAERRHDIGMLRAIGANRRTIIGMILAEGLIQGVVGTGIGLILGYMLGAGILALMSSTFSTMLHLTVGAPVISVQLVIGTIVAGVGITIVAGLIPAFTASRVTPLEALRPSFSEAVKSVSKIGSWLGLGLIVASLLALISGGVELIALGALMFMVGLVLVAPFLIRPMAGFLSRIVMVIYAREGTGSIAKSNLSRNPSRAAITASATMIGMAVIVGMGGMVWSITGGFLGILQRSLGSDYLIMPPAVAVWGSNVGAKGELADKIRAIPGVDVVSTLRYASAVGDGQLFSLLGIDSVAYTKVASLTFTDGDPKSAYDAMEHGQALILNGVLAAAIKLKAGDTIQLSTPSGVKLYLVAGIAGDYLNAKVMTGYISQANLWRDFHKNEDIFYQLNLKPGADSTLVEQKLNKVLSNYSQFKLISGKGYFEQNKQLFNAVFSFFFVLLGIITAPSLLALLNTLTIGVLERTREIGMLRAIGATRKQVSRMVIAESMLLAAVGTLFGLLAGLYMGYVMVLGMKVGGYPVTYSFPYQGLIAATITGLVYGLVAASLPSKQASRMEIVKALRYE
jgi:putative ABC transport system permease protein